MLRQAAHEISSAAILKKRKEDISVLLIESILNQRSVIVFVWEWFTRYAILTLDPPTEVDKLAPLRTEGTKRVVFPLDWLTAGRTFHHVETEAV